MIQTKCPHCDHIFKIPAHFLDKKVVCGHCSSSFLSEKYEEKRQRHPVKARHSSFMGKTPHLSCKNIEQVPALGEEGKMIIEEFNQGGFQSSFESKEIKLTFLVLALFLLTLSLFVYLVFLSEPHSFLGDMQEMDRFLLISFVCALDFFLFILAFRKKSLVWGVFLGLFSVGALISMNYWFNFEQEGLMKKLKYNQLLNSRMSADTFFVLPTDDLEKEPPYLKGNLDSLDSILKEREKEGTQNQALGIWVNDTNYERNMQIARWLQRMHKLETTPPIFERANNAALFVVPQALLDLKAVAFFSKRIGSVKYLDKKRHLLVVDADDSSFVAPSEKDLSNQSSDDYYPLNLNELRSIDSFRVRAAAIRLKNTPPLVLKDDVRRSLVNVFKEGIILSSYSDVECAVHIAEAMIAWANPLDNEIEGLVADLSKEVIKLPVEEGIQLPTSFVSFLLAQKSKVGNEILYKLWKDAPTIWQSFYKDAPHSMEEEMLAIIKKKEEISLAQKRSAMMIMERWATPKSYKVLESYENDPDLEVRTKARAILKRLVNEMNQETEELSQKP